MGARVSTAVRIGNCSGFYGDRHSAMREMLTGGELDYVTGDYLAELTMLILARDRAKSPDRGYAKTFLTQLEECLGTALDKGVRIAPGAHIGVDPEADRERFTVSPGGVVVIPKAFLDLILAEGAEQERMEAWIVEQVNGGAVLPGLYPMNAETKARYAASKK